jgi:hypothetical protein
VAAAISLFGFESGAALATVVGVLIEIARHVRNEAAQQLDAAFDKATGNSCMYRPWSKMDADSTRTNKTPPRWG